MNWSGFVGPAAEGETNRRGNALNCGREVGGAVGGCGCDAVEPVQRSLEVEVIPEAVSEDEGVWFLWLSRRE